MSSYADVRSARSRARLVLRLGSAALLASCAGNRMGVPTAELASLSADGPLTVATCTDLPDVPEFLAVTIYDPRDAPGPVGGVAIAPRFTEEQRHISWWGPRLASHGYAVVVLDTNDSRERPEARAAALMAGVRLRAAIPFTPWELERTLSGVRVPTLILAGESDRIAEVDEHAWRHFTLIPHATPKDGDERYRDFLYGARFPDDAAKFSRYVADP